MDTRAQVGKIAQIERIGQIRSRALLVAAALLAIAPLAARAEADAAWLALGRTVANELTGGHFDRVEARFDAKMVAALPPGKLAGIWSGLLAQTGAFRAVTGARAEDAQGYHLVFVTCRFEHATLDAKLVFDGTQHLAGLFFVPSQPAVEWSTPDYARPGSFHERAVVVGRDPWQLPGTLTLPAGTGPFPAVVLVHGSGPQDGDETIGPNKPFKDLAWGLASRGIAVLRYTKRTAAHGAQMTGTFTVEEETVADARAAVALAAAQPEVDRARVYVLGHSLGGMLAPRIAKEANQEANGKAESRPSAQGTAPVAGLILMAGTTRPLETVVVEQVRYLAGLDAAHATATAETVRDAEQAARDIESPSLTPTTTVKLLGAAIPGSYFLDLRGYDPARTAAALGLPVLVLQGDRDYQVTRADFDGWKAALGASPRATFHTYPGLFHLFMPSTTPGNGLGSPADYERPGHVAAPVVEDVAAWILGLQKAHS